MYGSIYSDESIHGLAVTLTILPERDHGILLARLDVLNAEAEALQEQVDEQVREVRDGMGAV